MAEGGIGCLLWWPPSPVQTARVCSKTCKRSFSRVYSFTYEEQRKFKHISSIDFGTRELLSLHTSKLPLLHDLQVSVTLFKFSAFSQCISLITIFYCCLRSTNSVPYVPGHRYFILQRFTKGELEKKKNRLKLLKTERRKPENDEKMKKVMRIWKNQNSKNVKHGCQTWRRTEAKNGMLCIKITPK